VTLRRHTPLKRSWMKRKPRSTSHARRERDVPYMKAVRGLPCMLSGLAGAGQCSGDVQADHAGDKRDADQGDGYRADDRTCIPMCQGHHEQRTGKVGGFGPFFGPMSKVERRHWCDVAIGKTQLAIAEKRARVAPHAESRRP